MGCIFLGGDGVGTQADKSSFHKFFNKNHIQGLI